MEGGIQTTAVHWQILFVCLLIVTITRGVHSQNPDQPTFTHIQDAEKKGAVCNDGTPAGYFYVPGFGEGASNWLILLEGGGWCRSDATCSNRGYSGTSKDSVIMNFTGILNSNPAVNPDFYNWNRVYIHYCDGGSFLGDTEVNNGEYHFQLRGSKIYNAAMEELLAKGMQHATNAILTGGSAGGLAAMLHCDDFRALLPNVGRVKCFSDAGFFLRAPDVPYNDYRDRVFVETLEYRNLTNHLNTSCTSTNASLCLFPEYFVETIKTPLFILNSAFDNFQIHDNLQPAHGDYDGWRDCTNTRLQKCKPSHKEVVSAFRNEFMKAVEKVSQKPSVGLYINNCYSHVYMINDRIWNSDAAPRLGNKTMAQALGDWYFDRSPVKLIDKKNDWVVDCSFARND